MEESTLSFRDRLYSFFKFSITCALRIWILALLASIVVLIGRYMRGYEGFFWGYLFPFFAVIAIYMLVAVATTFLIVCASLVFGRTFRERINSAAKREDILSILDEYYMRLNQRKKS